MCSRRGRWRCFVVYTCILVRREWKEIRLHSLVSAALEADESRMKRKTSCSSSVCCSVSLVIDVGLEFEAV